jgi:hypothetical protein
MKKLKLILVLTLGLTVACKGQSLQERFNDYKTSIIGTWISEEDSSNKIQFLSNNILKIYVDNNLENTIEYELNTFCGTNSNKEYDVFLKIKIDLTNYNCDIINNIITDSSGKTTLSITTERGKLELYIKQ